MKIRFITCALAMAIVCIIDIKTVTALTAHDSLPGIQNILPSSWTFRIDTPSDSAEWPRGLDKPLFTALFTDTINQISGCFLEPVHPCLKLCFYPITLQNSIETIIEKESIFSWCIPLKYLLSPRYFIVTSPCYINNGCFSPDAQKMIAPLDSALAVYFKPVKHIPLRDSVVVEPHIFSGRVDPRFVIYDSVNIVMIRRKIDSLEIKLGTNGISVTNHPMWWRGMRITYFPLPFMNKAYSPFELGSDSIACYFPSVTRVMPLKDHNFEQYIIDILVKEDAVSIRGKDTIRAKELVKSLWAPTKVSKEQDVKSLQPDVMIEGVTFRSNRAMMTVLLNSPQITSVELFDYQGRMIGVLFSGVLPSGSNRITLPQKAIAKGAGVLRIRTDTFCRHLVLTNFK